MEHHYSVLYDKVNRLLIWILGEAPETYQKYLGLDSGYWLPDHVIMAIGAVILLAALLIPVSRRLSVEKPGKAQQIFELFVTGLGELVDDMIGHGAKSRFLPIIGGFAVFIFTCNIFGLIYFLQPATQVTSTTFALSITAFIYYNIVGIRSQGPVNYIKHFCGPIWWLAPLMFPIELISHAARILSLALRLFGNIFGEHTATAKFFAIFPLLVPWPMMGLGIFGALLQAFIFIMLTMAYLQGAVAAEEH